MISLWFRQEIYGVEVHVYKSETSGDVPEEWTNGHNILTLIIFPDDIAVVYPPPMIGVGIFEYGNFLNSSKEEIIDMYLEDFSSYVEYIMKKKNRVAG